MAKTEHLGLNLTEDESTPFSNWRRSIDGNNANGNESNMQILDAKIYNIDLQVRQNQEDCEELIARVETLEDNPTVDGGNGNADEIINKILDPDNYPLSENTNIQSFTISLKIGKLSTTDGTETADSRYLCTPNFIDVTSYATITPVFNIGNATKIRVLFYDSTKTYLGLHKSVDKDATLKFSDVTSSASYIKCYISFDNAGDNPLSGELTLNFAGEDSNATKAEHKKVYLADHGYSIYGDEIDDDTMHKVVIYAEGKDDNSYNITEIKAPESNPEEATLCLMNSGNGITQFVDFSSMVYDPANPEVVIVCQTRGGKQLPKFAIQFRNENTSRVSKFTVQPDAIPIELTKDGIKVRKNNNTTEGTDDEYVTVSLIDFLDRITTLESNPDTGGGLTQSQVQSIVNEEIAKVVANAPADFDTLKEIAEWIKAHPEDVSALNTLVQENKDSIQSLESSKQDKLTAGDNITIQNGVISTENLEQKASIVQDGTSTEITLTPTANSEYYYGKLSSLELSFGEGNTGDMWYITFTSGEVATTLTVNGTNAVFKDFVPEVNSVVEICGKWNGSKWNDSKWVVLFMQTAVAV